MRKTLLLPLTIVATLLLPWAAAAENTTNVTVGVAPGPAQSTGIAGMSTTAIVVLVVLAVLVISLIVALAGRNDSP